VTYEHLGDLEHAQQDYLRAIPEQLDLPEAYGNLERVILAYHDAKVLIAAYTELVNQHPDQPDIRYQRAMLYRRVGLRKDATADLEICLNLHPSALLQQKIQGQLRGLKQLGEE
jgi:tetratricopeptide (TPR) repeat protein